MFVPVLTIWHKRKHLRVINRNIHFVNCSLLLGYGKGGGKYTWRNTNIDRSLMSPMILWCTKTYIFLLRLFYHLLRSSHLGNDATRIQKRSLTLGVDVMERRWVWWWTWKVEREQHSECWNDAKESRRARFTMWDLKFKAKEGERK